MEKKPNQRISVQIADSSLSLVTDEAEDLVLDAAARLDERIRDMTKNNFRINTLDASLLCAVEAMVGRQKAEKRIRSLEAQLSLSESTARSLREDLDDLRRNTAAHDDNPPSAVIRNDDGACGPADAAHDLPLPSASTQEEKIHALEQYLDASRTDTPATREEKIRYIESLLRGGKN